MASSSQSQKNETKLIFDVNSHPFSDQIMAEPLASPFPFQFPNIEKYSIFNDPTEHLQIFTSQMLPYAASDALRCRLFPTTLSKEALPWFFDLAPKSINSFQELANSFVMKFALCKPFNNPFAFKQKKNETAQDFIGRVNSSLIADGVKASPDEIIGVIRKGLRDGSFKETEEKSGWEITGGEAAL